MWTTTRTTTRRTGAVLAAVTALLLGGCSTGTGDSGDSAGAAAEPVREQAADRDAGGDGPARDRTSARVLPQDRDIVYRGRITVRVKNVDRAAARAEDLAVQVDGVVFSEETSVDPDRRGTGEARLTLRVPPAQFRSTLDAIGALGKELSRSRGAEDVTTELADVDSRVRSQERSVERVRALLGEADTIGEVVQVESELARREADLESLQAQLARLRDVTDLATIDVTLIAPRAPVPDGAEEDRLGFLSGLRGGWAALAEVGLVALTVVGALLPFIVAAAILALPAYALLRARRRPAASPET